MPTAKTPTAGETQVPAPGTREAGGRTEKKRREKGAVLAGPPEQRITLHGIRWDTYENLLEDLEDSSAPRLTYDRGTLEIMSPLPDHEKLGLDLTLLVEFAAEARRLDIRGLGSTTFRREDLARGFEPDACFYFRHAASMRRKSRIDLSIDPPPDLVIEIDVTHSTLDKLSIYAQLGVSEVWRCAAERVSILVLRDGAYHEQEESALLPGVNATDLTSLLEDALALPRPEWLQKAREWAGTTVAEDA